MRLSLRNFSSFVAFALFAAVAAAQQQGEVAIGQTDYLNGSIAYTVGASEFRTADPADKMVPAEREYWVSTESDRTTAHAFAALHLPDGVVIDGLELFSCTEWGDGLWVTLHDECKDGSCGGQRGVVSSQPGCNLTYGAFTHGPINNLERDYFLRLDSVTNTPTTTFRTVRVVYRKSLPTLPAAPTFADVPADHWAYNAIEAMKSLGVTAGCTSQPPRYCPEGLVTRAEMAVFLSRVLGPPAPTQP